MEKIQVQLMTIAPPPVFVSSLSPVHFVHLRLFAAA